MARLSKKNEELLKAVQKQTAREQGNTAGQAPQNGQTAKDVRDSSTVGVGVDLVEIERMERALARTPRILERVFTSGEREYAQGKAKPQVHYATFFAAREAVLKALGSGFAGMGYQDVEITHDGNGRPLVLLHGAAAARAEQQGITEIQISLSHTHQMAVASAVAIKALSAPRKKENIDPMEALARQFKELRSMLDDLGVNTRDSDEANNDEANSEEAEEDLLASTPQEELDLFGDNPNCSENSSSDKETPALPHDAGEQEQVNGETDGQEHA